MLVAEEAPRTFWSISAGDALVTLGLRGSAAVVSAAVK
jgi:hypothetical protein